MLQSVAFFIRTYIYHLFVLLTPQNCESLNEISKKDIPQQFFFIAMTVDERIQKSETRIFKAVFPNTTNHYDTLFGGTAMQLMDEVAFITATRFSRQRMVTVSSDRIDFTKPIPAGTIVELIGRVSKLGKTSLKVQVEIYIEEMYSYSRQKAVKGEFTFVAIDENKNPINVL